MKSDCFEIEGTVIDCLPGTKFKVELENGLICTCTIAGKLRQNNIRILKHDSVTVEISGADVSRGRITYRNK